MATPIFEGPVVRVPEYNGGVPKDETFDDSVPFLGGPIVSFIGNGLLVQQQYDIGASLPGDAWLHTFYAFPGGSTFNLPQFLNNASTAGDEGTSGNPSILDGSPVHLCFFGNIGNDTAVGGSNDDELYGDGGFDTLIGNGGDDYIDGGSGFDFLFGGSGNDIMYGGLGSDTMNGGSGDDYMEGNDGADNMSGDDGHDQMSGGAGNDSMSGGNGNDIMAGDDGDDFINGNDGDDEIDGGTGNDTIFAGSGNDDVLGGDGDDDVYLEDGDDVADLGSGDDYASGGSGNDTILGNTGSDEIYGDAGDDEISGGDGDDYIDGGDGNDILVGNEGADTMFGGSGNDQLWSGIGNDVLTGGLGADIFGFADDELLANFTGPPTIVITDFNLLENDQIDLTCVEELDFMDVVEFDADTILFNLFEDSNNDNQFTADDEQLLQIQVNGPSVGTFLIDDSAYSSADGLSPVLLQAGVGIDLPTNDDSEFPGLYFV